MSEPQPSSCSLTKGCFLFKPNEVIPSKKKKSVKQVKLNAIDYYPKFVKENKSEKDKRYRSYENCWNALDKQIKEVQHNLNNKIFDELLSFVKNAYNGSSKDMFPIAEIPTAALVTGVNLPDHDVIFSQLVTSIKSTFMLSYMVRIQSKDCTNLKSIMRNTFDGFVKNLNEEEAVSFYEVEDEDLNKSNSKKSTVFKDYTFKELKQWYESCLLTISDIMEVEEINISIDTSSSIDTSNNIDKRPPLVIIFEDFERFPPSVLQDFILIASEYIHHLPIIFIFGIATAVSAIHRFLPHFVSSRLSIEKFQSQPSLVCLTEVIDKVLLSNKNAFKLGPHVFRLLYEHFLYHDFSIYNFVKALKFAVLDHFSENEFSLLCTFDEKDIVNFINTLTRHQVNLFKDIPSYYQYYDKQAEAEQRKLETDEKYVEELILQLIEDLQHQEKLFFPLVKCFHVLTSNLPGHPLGKRLRDTYEYITISPKIINDPKYKHSFTLLRMLSRDELVVILNACQEILTKALIGDSECEVFNTEVDLISDFLLKFQELESILNEDVVDPPLTPKTPATPKTPTVFKSRHEFKEKMKSAVKEKRKESPYEKLRHEIINMFDNLFKKHLQSPLSMPLHELFYYNDSYTLKQRINGAPRMAIQTALSNPKSYLKCTCCPSSTDVIQDTLPDVCILYKLHLECAKLINLYDWLQAFITVIDPSLTDEKTKKKSKQKLKLEEQLQARFIRGVSELQYLGFIKGTKRKTDHVARLTWGGC